MGVPKFFRWLSERYPKVNQRLGRVPEESTLREHFNSTNLDALPRPDPLSECSTMPSIDRLYIDMNGIIHGCSHNNNNGNQNGGDDDTETVSRISEAQVFANCCYYLDRIVRDIVQPNALVYLAVDGVAPRAKLNQQRARRYRSGKEGEIERTVYDAHLKKLLEEQKRDMMEEEEELLRREAAERSSSSSLGGLFLEEEEVLGMPSRDDSSNNNKDKDDDSDDDEIQEIEPGRFAGKFEAHLQANDSSKKTSLSSKKRNKGTDRSSTDNDGNEDDDDDDDNLFHSNQITPGTPFFARCTAHLQHFLQRKVSEDPAWQKLTVIFSGPATCGEGEHKIMQFMREQKTAYEVAQQQKQNQPSRNHNHNNNNNNNDPLAYHPNLRHCIMGQDGDLIMLGLLSHEPNLVLLREQVLFDARRRQRAASSDSHGISSYIHNANFELLHMNVLRDYFAFEFETSNVLPGTSSYDLEQCIDDFVFLTFLVGNDFLPHMPAVDIADEAFDFLFYTYRELRTRWLKESKAGGKQKKHSNKPPYLTDSGKIVCGKRLEEFFQVLGQHETPYLEFKKQTDDPEKNRELEARYGQKLIPSDEVIAAKEASDRALFREHIEARRRQDQLNDSTSSNDGSSSPDSVAEEEAEAYPDFQPVLTTVQQRKTTRSTNKGSKQRRGDHLHTAEEDEDAVAMQQRMGGLLRHTLEGGKHSNSNKDGDVHINDQDLKGRYYSDKFGFGPFDAEKHMALRKAYLQGLVWNLKYYYEGCASWEWYYPYHYGPMLSDLVNIEGMLKEIDFEMGKPLKPFEQLLACMPPSHATVLPEPYRPLMTSEDSPIADFYPQSFTIDMNGKRWPWEAVVLLPFIDSKRLLLAAATVDDSQLTDEERQRNMLGGAVVYSYDPSSARRLEAVGEGEGAIFSAVEECTAKCLPLESTPLHYRNHDVKPLFRPKLWKEVEAPLPGFPTLRDGSVQGLWRKMLRVNVHGSNSRYKTACLELENPQVEVIPTETIAQHLIGTVVWINYPHFIEALVTAVSDSEGYIRGKTPRQPWNKEDAEARRQRVSRIVDDYVFGEKMVGTGGITLAGGEETMDDLDVLLNVRPFRGLQTMDDGTVVKTFAKFEVEVPLFVTAWMPKKVDERFMNLPARLEKDPFHAAKEVITDKHTPTSTEKSKKPVPIVRGKILGSKFSYFQHRIHQKMLHSPRNYSTVASIGIPEHADWRHGIACTVTNHFRSRGLAINTSFAHLSSPTTTVRFPHHLSVTCRDGSVIRRRFHRAAGNSRGNAIAIGLLAAVSFLVNGARAMDFSGYLEASPARFGSSRLCDHWSLTDAADIESPPPVSKRPTPPIEFAHGTTTLSFSFQGGIVAAVDSRATLGSFVGSKTTQKVLPINSHVLGTMAGGAADCMYWIRKIRCEAALYELTEGRRMPVAQCSRMLSNCLYANRGLGLSVGTMVMGFDDTSVAVPKIFYVDDTGVRLEGDMFAVGSGSTLALGILDSERRYEMTEEEAVALGIKAIRHATFRDAYSGGFINVYLITRDGWKRVYTEDLDRLAASIIFNEL